MRRTVVFKDYQVKPPTIIGRVWVEAGGPVSWDASLNDLRFERGIYNPDTRQRVMPDEGVWFLQEVVEKFGHSMGVRAKWETEAGA